MTSQELKHTTESTLSGLIDHDYMLLDLPYYGNVGDVLIWEATEMILRECGQKCVYASSIETYEKQDVSEKVVIVLMGGGNFGDMWARHQELRHKVMDDYPNNKIVQLPQSVWFTSTELMKRDIEKWAKHKGEVTLCLRDRQSKAIIDSHYKNVRTRLVPDMVLTMDIEQYMTEHNMKSEYGKGTLIVERQDCEKNMANGEISLSKEAVHADWPTLEKTPTEFYIFWAIRKLAVMLGMNKKRVTDWMWRHWLKDVVIKSGIRFIDSYETIYSTRLHAAITGWLLGKNVKMIDNSYGKCKGVYEAWLNDQEQIEMI